MEESNGIVTAFKLLGERIEELESNNRMYEYMNADMRQKVAKLEEENERLRAKLDEVKEFVRKKEEEGSGNLG